MYCSVLLNGSVVYRNERDQLHRLDGPAIESVDGHKEWWVDGQRHRLDGPAYESKDGHKSWWVNNKRHRLDGPAIEWSWGRKEWYINDKRHRLDGPAIESVNGDRVWFIYYEEIESQIANTNQFQRINNLLRLTLLQNKSRKFNEWLFDPDHYAGKWHKKNMLRDFQDS